MQENKYWDIDNQNEQELHTITGKKGKEGKEGKEGEESELVKFSFVVKRLKDIYSNQEVLKITAYYKGDDYGSIVAKISSLEQEIRNLSNIGIYLSINEYRELYALIRNNYYKFIPVFGEGIENNIPDKVVEGVVKLLAEAIQENEIQEKDGYYNVPTEIFNNTINESVFRRYKSADIKEALKIRSITKCNQDRNDYAVKVEGNKTKRFICINKECLGNKEKSNG